MVTAERAGSRPNVWDESREKALERFPQPSPLPMLLAHLGGTQVCRELGLLGNGAPQPLERMRDTARLFEDWAFLEGKCIELGYVAPHLEAHEIASGYLNEFARGTEKGGYKRGAPAAIKCLVEHEILTPDGKILSNGRIKPGCELFDANVELATKQVAGVLTRWPELRDRLIGFPDRLRAKSEDGLNDAYDAVKYTLELPPALVQRLPLVRSLLKRNQAVPLLFKEPISAAKQVAKELRLDHRPVAITFGAGSRAQEVARLVGEGFSVFMVDLAGHERVERGLKKTLGILGIDQPEIIRLQESERGAIKFDKNLQELVTEAQQRQLVATVQADYTLIDGDAYSAFDVGFTCMSLHHNPVSAQKIALANLGKISRGVVACEMGKEGVAEVVIPVGLLMCLYGACDTHFDAVASGNLGSFGWEWIKRVQESLPGRQVFLRERPQIDQMATPPLQHVAVSFKEPVFHVHFAIPEQPILREPARQRPKVAA